MVLVGLFLNVTSKSQEDVLSRWEALVIGDVLQIRENLLNLHQAVFEAGHGENGELVPRVDGQDSQQPPAASWTVWSRLETKKKK